MSNSAVKSSNNRAGKRKDRNKCVEGRRPELGYYLIVTDTEQTEKNYFEGLRDTVPKELKNRLVIKVDKAKTINLVNKAMELIEQDSQYRMPWIVLDRDQVKDFDEIIEAAEKNNISVGWSNPCIEIWLYAYFGEMPLITESYECCKRFGDRFEKIVGQKYNKNDKNIYSKLVKHGDEQEAVKLAERYYENAIKEWEGRPSKMCPACTVHRLVKEILIKIGKI